MLWEGPRPPCRASAGHAPPCAPPNAANLVTAPQLRYGEDGMDPVAMEGKGGEPVMFNRVLSVRWVCWAQRG